MDLTLIARLCGLFHVVVMVVLSLVCTGFALYLASKVKRADLLQAFLPVTFLPAIAGLISSLQGMVDSVGLQFDNEVEYTYESGLLLQMNLVPLVAGLVACVPAATVVILARWWLAWQSGGLRLFPEPRRTESVAIEEPADEQTWMARETDDYLEKLVRPK